MHKTTAAVYESSVEGSELLCAELRSGGLFATPPLREHHATRPLRVNIRPPLHGEQGKGGARNTVDDGFPLKREVCPLCIAHHTGMIVVGSYFALLSCVSWGDTYVDALAPSPTTRRYM